MAATPRMDLNNYSNYFSLYDNGSQYNRAIGMAYEPGSVLKVLTMAAALDTGTVSPDTTFIDTGAIEVGGITIHNWNRDCVGPAGYDRLSAAFLECLPGLGFHPDGHAELSMATWNALVWVTPQGSISPGKRPAGSRSRVMRIGIPSILARTHSVRASAVTPLQMLMAVSSIANDGQHGHTACAVFHAARWTSIQCSLAICRLAHLRRNRPHTERDAGHFTGTGILPGACCRVIASPARPAQRRSRPTMAMTPSHTNVSFIGWGPVDDPQFMVYVWLQKPSASIWASETAAPVFSQVAEQTVISAQYST